MKALVITLDKCCRLNPGTAEVLEPFRPSVVTITEFINDLGLRRLIKAAPLPDEATDEEFLKFWKEAAGDADLAVDSFLSSFKNIADHEADALLDLGEQAKIQEAERRKKADDAAAADAAAQKAQEEANAASVKKAADDAAKEAQEKAAAAAAAKPVPAAAAAAAKEAK